MAKRLRGRGLRFERKEGRQMDVQKFLKGNGVAFESIKHEEAYTAQEVAAAEHVSGHKFAKTAAQHNRNIRKCK